MTWTAATTPSSHPLTHTRLAIRINPSRGDPNRPFSPGDSLSGEISLIVDNEEGVKDVKHKLSVASVGIRVFWEASESTVLPSFSLASLDTYPAPCSRYRGREKLREKSHVSSSVACLLLLCLPDS